MILFFGVLIALSIIVSTLWSIRMISAGPPPEPDLTAIEEVDVPYLCIVCGLSLTVTEAQVGAEIDPPRHCREDMVRAI